MSLLEDYQKQMISFENEIIWINSVLIVDGHREVLYFPKSNFNLNEIEKTPNIPKGELTITTYLKEKGEKEIVIVDRLESGDFNFLEKKLNWLNKYWKNVLINGKFQEIKQIHQIEVYNKNYYLIDVNIAFKKYDESQKFKILNSLSSFFVEYLLKLFHEKSTRSAIQSILIDSFAHNISAHSLNFLQEMFAFRSENYLKKNYSLLSFDKLKNLPLNNINYYDFYNANKLHLENNSNEDLTYYTLKGQNDSTNTIYYANILDYLLYNGKNQNEANNLLRYSIGEGKLPIPLDYAIAPLLMYLRDKGSFWSGVIRNNQATPSQIINFYNLLMEFFENPLFVGSIVAAEKFFIIHLFVKIKEDEDEHLLTVNLKDFVRHELKYELEDAESFDNGKYKYGNVKHSNLSFVRLSANHNELKKKLEEIEVLMPGGIVGRHAFYTIIENTLRNAKHIKSKDRDKIGKNGLEIHFSVKETSFNSQLVNDNKFLYEIGLFLNYSFNSKYRKKIENIESQLIETVISNSYSPILSQDGKPRMGGNSQDKICAAALFNKNFTAVEYNSTEVESYYPWMFYNLIDDEGKYGIEKNKIYLDLEYKKRNEKQNYLLNKEYKTPNSLESKCTYKKTLYIKLFHLWKAQDVSYIKPTEHSSESQNSFINTIPRYKIGIVSDDEQFRNLRTQAIVRIICDNSNSNQTKDEFGKRYFEWNESWLGKDQKSLILNRGKNFQEIPFDLDTLGFKRIDNVEKTKDVSINIEHDEGAEKSNACKLRSHGNFLNYFMKCNISGLFDKEIITTELKQELFETIFTQITLIDNRLFETIDRYCFAGVKEKKHENILKNKLLLTILNEEIALKKLKSLVSIRIKKHFYIFHLSFVEGIIKDNPKLFNHSNYEIDTFIEQVFGIKPNAKIPNNLIIGMTTGRGREEWLSKTERFRHCCIHVPIESLQSAIQQGVNFKDDFDIKYNLCKVLFGS